ncbi:hypothetical protein [Sulfurospirillum deleyianum]|uniref:Uncharacterized protein n=1 Tax=Sulfurospirillum deleyianum (strain ATCC 51133 / DSM 6946 / 5175) TaxID=525898 RepID=D1B1R5_SULD5|nr:hypothetical protein [Sulfurospirillum deleyianum]ACZ12035.1 hypothetical protein Sdel_1010 [Sulfurospirillum deleyianum DSM 6946]
MTNKLILLRKIWLLSDLLISFIVSFIIVSYLEKHKGFDDPRMLLLFLLPIVISWIYFIIYPSYGEILLKFISIFIGYLIGSQFWKDEIDSMSSLLILLENSKFYIAIFFNFIFILLNWIFAQIILKVIRYFRGKKDRLL